MKITKWVDFGCEVDVDISSDDIRAALSESFSEATRDNLGEPPPGPRDVLRALNGMAAFLNALTNEQISALTPGQRKVVASFLAGAAERFKEVVA